MQRTKTPQKLKVLVWTLLSCLLLSVTALAQTKRLTGTITAEDTNEPLPGATVTVKGTNRITTTNEKGEYFIDAITNEVLVISSVGYAPKEILVGSSANIATSLTTLFVSQNEVVVVGYGRMKKTDLSSSQVAVTSEEIKRTVNTTFDQALQGRAANVYVTSNSGQPGAAPSVMIRGVNSINYSNQPLYVIDGVQIKPDNPGGGANILSAINPDDIETMNVLQGPSATAIYGATGANGVILITTKRGKAGEAKASFNTLWTIQDVPKYIPVMNLREYAEYRNEYAKAGRIAADPLFADPSVLGEGTNWQKELFRKTLLNKQVLSLSGGTDKTTFYLSGEYFNQDGIANGSGFKRYSMRLNLDNQTRSWLKIGTNINVTRTQEEVNLSNAGLLNLAIRQNPSIPVKNPDGSWGGPATTQFQFSNPIALAEINDNTNKSMAFIGGAYANITFAKGLVLYNEVNGTYQYNTSYRFNPSYRFNGLINETTTGSRSASNNYWWGLNNRLQYDKEAGRHSVSAMIAHEAQAWAGEGLQAGRQNWVTNAIPELDLGDSETATNGSSKYDGAKESYFGRLNYVFNERYILQATYRADGSANFGPDKRWGYFPSLSIAWRASRENFMQNISVVNDLKFRMEYGLSGNSNAAGYWASLQPIPTPWGTGFLSERFSNSLLAWETARTYDIGFDLSLLKNRIEVIADFYIKDISDLLTVNDYPYYSGGDMAWSPGYIQFPTTNVGSMQNKGFGITINSVNINKPFVWKTGLNFSLDRNKVTSLINPINSGTASLRNTTIVGQPAALLTGYIADGLFQDYKDIESHAIQTPTATRVIHPDQGSWVGDVKFRDLNNDGYINEKDRTVIGNPWPKFTYGLNNSFSYKNFNLNIFVMGTQGNDVYNLTREENMRPGGTGDYSNYMKEVSGFARPSSITPGDQSVTLINPGGRIARIGTTDANGSNRASQWYVEDGSYLRVKNIMLGYTIPNRIAAKTGLKGLRIAANVQNAFTFTRYKGYDPEIGMNSGTGGALIVGVDNGRYPSTRMYTINLTADF